MKIQIQMNQNKVSEKLLELMNRLNFDIEKVTLSDDEIEYQAFNAANSYLNYIFMNNDISGITLAVLNVRELPTTKSKIVKTLPKGTKVEIKNYSLETNFYEINDGYIYMDYVKIS